MHARGFSYAVSMTVTISLVACTSLHRTSDGTGAGASAGTMTITEDQIAHSGATTAWEVLRRNVTRYTYAEDQLGRPHSIRSQRGASSLILPDADTPMIIIDGARVTDLIALADLSAGAIDSIEVLSAIRGTGPQGTNASAGVIYIHTHGASNP